MRMGSNEKEDEAIRTAWQVFITFTAGGVVMNGWPIWVTPCAVVGIYILRWAWRGIWAY